MVICSHQLCSDTPTWQNPAIRFQSFLPARRTPGTQERNSLQAPSPHPNRSSSPYLHHRSNALPADGADVDPLRTLLARRHVPAVVKQGVHLFFIAYVTHGHFLVRHLKLHRPLAVPFPLLEPTDIDVSRFGVDHLALPVRLVRMPLSRISVTVRVRHGTQSTNAAGDKIARVCVAGHGDQHTETVGATVFLGGRQIRAAEITLHPMVLEIGGDILITEPCKEINRVRALALGLESRNPNHS